MKANKVAANDICKIFLATANGYDSLCKNSHFRPDIHPLCLKNTIQSANYEQEKHYFCSVKPTMAKAELDKRKKGSRRSKDAKRLKWRERGERVCDIHTLRFGILCGLLSRQYFNREAPLYAGEINENTFCFYDTAGSSASHQVVAVRCQGLVIAHFQRHSRLALRELCCFSFHNSMAWIKLSDPILRAL